MRLSLFAAVICMSIIGVSAAGDANAAVRQRTNIEAQGLGPALQFLAKERGLQIVYRSELVGDLRTSGATGDLTVEEALAQLLKGTGLTFRTLGENAITIVPLASPPESEQRSGSTAGPSFTRGAAQGMRVAQAERDSKVPASESSAEDRVRETRSQDLPAPGETGKAIPEILVQGKRSLNTDIRRTRDDAQPYVVFDRAVIEQSGAVTLDEFFKNRLTMSSGSTTGNQGGLGGNPSSRINLRGLGANQTLILIDGHRAAGYSTGSGEIAQPDVNGIPLSAIERIEVLPTTASGIYGGGATGGVVNIVMRRDYSGIEAKVGYGSSFDGGGTNRRVDISAGANFEDGRSNILVTGSYADANPILVRDRNFEQRGRQWIEDRNPSSFLDRFIPPLGATTNICSGAGFCDGQELVLRPEFGGASLGASQTFVPRGYAGAASDNAAALAANAGRYDLDLADTAQINGGDRQSLVNHPTIESLGVTLRRELTSNIKAFLEGNASNNSSRIRLSGASNQTFLIPAGAPNNPFQQDITVNTPALGADQTAIATNYSRRAIAGVIVSLPAQWHAETDYTWHRTRFFSSSPDLLTADAAAAIASGALDVLRDTNVSGADFSPYAGDPSVFSPIHTTLKDATLRLAGPLPWTLPAGPITLSMLLEHREESVDRSRFAIPSQAADSIVPGRSQAIDSTYAELLVPLFSPRNGIPAVKGLELQVAARRDEYRVKGATASISALDPTPAATFRNESSATSPTFAVRYQPVSDLMVRASYGKGFLPPSVNQLVPFTPFALPAAFFGLTDPRRGGELVLGDSEGNLTLSGGGNPNLRPEQSRSWSAGVVFTPRALEGLRMSLDWTRIRKTDEITSLAQVAQTDFDNEPFAPGLIVRGPVPAGDPFGVGPVIGINGGLFNVAHRTMEAYDLSLDYHVQTASAGRFDFSSAATRLMHLSTQLSPIAPIVENAGAIATIGQEDAGLRWKANATLFWSFRDWRLGWSSRFFDRYFLNPGHTVEPNQGSATVPSQIYHDFTGSYTFGPAGGLGGNVLADTEIQLGVKNIFNKKPPVDVIGPAGGGLGFSYGYSTWGDPSLATYYISLRKQF